MCIKTRKLISVEYVFINLKMWLHKYWISQNALYYSGFTQDIVLSYYQNIINYNNLKRVFWTFQVILYLSIFFLIIFKVSLKMYVLKALLIKRINKNL